MSQVAEEAKAPATEAFGAEDQAFKVIQVDKIDESKTNPRRTFDAKAMETLEASIREKGILNPAIVRPTDGGRYELVAGARRYRAAKKVGLFQVPCLVRKLSDAQALEAQVIENQLRSDVHPLEEAEGYRAMMKKAGYTVQQIAQAIGMSQAHVYQRLQLAELIDPAKEAFLKGEIPVSHAIEICRLSEADQKKTLPLFNQTVHVTNEVGRRKVQIAIGELKRWIRDELHHKLSSVPWDLADKTLFATGGACNGCPMRTSTNPELFSDLGREDVCTGPACFSKKWLAYEKLEREKLLDEGHTVVRISKLEGWKSEYRGDDRVLKEGNWTPAGEKKCDHLVKGQVVEGAGRGAVVDLCGSASCKVHHPKAAAARSSTSAAHKESAADVAKRRAAEEKAKRAGEREEELGRSMIRTVLEHAPDRLSIEDARTVLAFLSGASDVSDPSEVFGKGFEWVGGSPSESKLDQLKPRQVIGLIGILSSDILSWNTMDLPELRKLGKRWKLPFDQVEKELRKRWKAEDDAAAMADKRKEKRKR